MARILYAVQGEGMGHAIRSSVIIRYLLKKHELVIVSSNRAYRFLLNKFDNVYNIYGFHIVYKNNAVDNLKTFVQNVRKLPEGSVNNLRKLIKLIYRFNPNIIISDFEPFSYLVGTLFGIPIIGIDNIHIAKLCRLSIPKKYKKHYMTASLCPRSLGIKADYYLIPTFFYPKKKNPRKIFLVPPVIRDEIITSKPTDKSHVLVYQTSKSYKALIRLLKKIDQKFVIYGFNRKSRFSNIVFKRFDERNFIEDLTSCKAVITNGGFGVITEAIYLHKPILSVPVKKNFEQITNAIYVQELGYGKFYEELTTQDIEEFLLALPLYKKRLQHYSQKGNTLLFKKLDQIIKRLVS